MVLAAADYTSWYVGLALAFAAVAVVVIVVAVILTLAARIADQAQEAGPALELVREYTDELPSVPEINGSAIAILNAARNARKALTGA